MPVAWLSSQLSLPQCTCPDPPAQLNLTNASVHNGCQEKQPINCKYFGEFTLPARSLMLQLEPVWKCFLVVSTMTQRAGKANT